MPVLVDVSECLRDTPKFRQTLSENERSVQQLETKLDKLLKACDVSVQAGEQFFSAQEQLMTALLETSAHVDDCEASKLLNDVLQCLLTLKRLESSLMDQLREVVAKNCVQALKRELAGVKESRLTFEKVSGDLDAALVRHAQAPRSRMQEVRESGLLVNVTRSQFKHAGLDYLHRLSVTQCVKRLLIARLVRDCFAAQQSFFSQGLGACQQLDACLAGVQRAMTRLEAERSDLEQLVAGRRAAAASNSPEEDSRAAAELPRTASPTAGAVSIEGYLFKRASNAFRTWSRRWFMLDCSQLKYQRRSGDELTVMEEDLRLCMVKPAPGLERRCCFEVVSPSKSHMVQADSPRACQLWVEALQTAIGAAFDQPPPPSVSARRASCADSSSSTSTASTCSSVLQQVVRVAGNDLCADCGQSSPSWASINLGVTLCIQCSGIHRSLGVQVSKIRSLTLDDWEPEVLKSFAELGNAVVNEVYEAETPSAAAELRIEKPKPTSDRPKREAWIRAKYFERRFVGRLSPSAGEGNGDGGGGSVTRRWSVRRLRRRRSRSHDKRGRRAQQAPQSSSRPGLDTLVIGDQLTSSLPRLPDAELLDSSGTSSSDEQPAQPEQPLTPDSLLFRAAAAHNLPVMCQALAWGAQPSWRNPAAGGRTALHAAVGSGSAAACQYLLLNGAAASAVDDAGSSPLHRAVEVGHMGQVCVLLKHRVDQHLQDSRGRDALSIAVERADADMVTILRLALLNEQMRDEECSNGGDDTFNQVVKDFSLMASSERPGSRIPDDANT